MAAAVPHCWVVSIQAAKLGNPAQRFETRFLCPFAAQTFRSCNSILKLQIKYRYFIFGCSDPVERMVRACSDSFSLRRESVRRDLDVEWWQRMQVDAMGSGCLMPSTAEGSPTPFCLCLLLQKVVGMEVCSMCSLNAFGKTPRISSWLRW